MLADMTRKPRQSRSSRDRRSWLSSNPTTPGTRMRRDNIAGIPWGQMELEPEVSEWLSSLDDDRWAQALFHLDLLECRGVHLGEPYTRQLVGKLRELRRAERALARCQREGHSPDEDEDERNQR
jgi:Phage derived protein Gp49-like (DUF891)